MFWWLDAGKMYCFTNGGRQMFLVSGGWLLSHSLQGPQFLKLLAPSTGDFQAPRAWMTYPQARGKVLAGVVADMRPGENTIWETPLKKKNKVACDQIATDPYKAQMGPCSRDSLVSWHMHLCSLHSFGWTLGAVEYPETCLVCPGEITARSLCYMYESTSSTWQKLNNSASHWFIMLHEDFYQDQHALMVTCHLYQCVSGIVLMLDLQASLSVQQPR